MRLRRHITSKDFKGSIFVEFASEETAKKVIEMSNKLVYEGLELMLMFKKEYLEKEEGGEGVEGGTESEGGGG